MEHIYIFDYSANAIYHGMIGEDEEPEDFYKKHNLKEDNCFNLISTEELEIQELD